MKLTEKLTWFKSQFGRQIEDAVAGSPISVDLVAAIALQETGYIWPALLKRHGDDLDSVLEGCVGDTLDYPSRRAFPRNRQDLQSHPNGDAMFDIAREALAGLAEINSTYRKVYERNPDKFCRGYGILQYDLQHLRTDPDFFLDKQWARFEICLEKCLKELRRALRVRGFENRDSLSAFEAATAAIVYNRGRYDPARKLQQGHRGDGGKYYGENVFEYITLAQSLGADDHGADDHGADDRVDDDIDVDRAPVDAPPLSYSVNARSGLRLRGGPGTDYAVLDTLDYGSVVNILRYAGPQNEWALVDVEGDGALDGFMHASFLTPVYVADDDSDRLQHGQRREMVPAAANRNDPSRPAENDPECGDC